MSANFATIPANILTFIREFDLIQAKDNVSDYPKMHFFELFS